MLLNSVVLVLREVLEAAMVVSVLLALSRNLGISLRWLLAAGPVAALSVGLYAANLGAMTDAFDGVGQEVVNAGLQLFAFMCLASTVGLSQLHRLSGEARFGLALLMAGATVAALTREASEIIIYVTGFAADEDYRSAVYAGGIMGACIGISLGILLFAALRSLASLHSYQFCYCLLALIGAGMVMQAALLLEQADLMDPGLQLWDSSKLVSEQSLTGQLLFAVFGYEATPGWTQALLYLASLVIVVVAFGVGTQLGRGKNFV